MMHLALDVGSHDFQEVVGKHRLSEKGCCGEVCRNPARIASRNENERDMAMRELLRDWKGDAVGELHIQNSEANASISVEQRHRTRHTAGGRCAAVEIVLHQPRHGVGNDGVIFNYEDALLHTKSNAARTPIVPPAPSIANNIVKNYIKLKSARREPAWQIPAGSRPGASDKNGVVPKGRGIDRALPNTVRAGGADSLRCRREADGAHIVS